MNIFGKDLDRDVAVVAEMGVNHEGNVEAASLMLRLAAEAGVDAVKLQSYTPSRFVTTSNAERFARVQRFSLAREDYERLKNEANALKVTLFSTAVTEDVVEFLSTLSPVIKIASGDLNFRPVIDAAMASGASVILSTGNGSLDEIDRAVEWCRVAAPSDFADRLALLHCVAAYPAPIAQLNLRTIPFFKERYGLTVGFSNHAKENEGVLGAVALGAQIVEVHFTDQREGKTFHDHALSVEPAELGALVQSIKRIRSALGEQGRPEIEAEAALRPMMRKGLVAARDLAAGTTLRAEDLNFARPATEFEWSDLQSLVGRKLSHPLRCGELISRANVGLG